MKKKPEPITPLTEAEERQAWARLPKRPKRNAEAVTDVHGATSYAASEGIAHTRGEAQAWLRKQKLSKAERALVLAELFDNANPIKPLPRRHLARAAGKSPQWVADRLRRPRIQEAIRYLRSGRPLTAATSKRSAPRPRLVDYPRLYLFARLFDMQLPQSPEESYRMMNPTRMVKPLTPAEAQAQGIRKTWTVDTAKLLSAKTAEEATQALTPCTPFHILYSPEEIETKTLPNPNCPTLADHVCRIIRDFPETLLHPEFGPLYVTALVDTLTAAKCGDNKRRVAGLLPQGTLSEVAANARASLKKLSAETTGKKGTPGVELHQYDTYRLIYELANRIRQLQHEANAGRGEAASRADAIREAHRDELENISDMMLRTMLTEKPLEAAMSLAAKLTGNKESVFRRVLGRDFESLERAFQPDRLKRLAMLQQADTITAK